MKLAIICDTAEESAAAMEYIARRAGVTPAPAGAPPIPGAVPPPPPAAAAPPPPPAPGAVPPPPPPAAAAPPPPPPPPPAAPQPDGLGAVLAAMAAYGTVHKAAGIKAVITAAARQIGQPYTKPGQFPAEWYPWFLQMFDVNRPPPV